MCTNPRQFFFNVDKQRKNHNIPIETIVYIQYNNIIYYPNKLTVECLLKIYICYENRRFDIRTLSAYYFCLEGIYIKPRDVDRSFFVCII